MSSGYPDSPVSKLDSRTSWLLVKRSVAALGLSTDSFLLLILRYNYATLLWKYKKYKQAAQESSEIVKAYFNRLGLKFKDVFAKNPPEIFAKLEGQNTILMTLSVLQIPWIFMSDAALSCINLIPLSAFMRLSFTRWPMLFGPQ